MPTQVTVTGTFDSAPNTPAQGYVVWQLSNDLSDTNGNLICTTAPLKFPLVNGVMTANVWANDDTTVSPSGTYWTVSVYVVNGQYGGPAPLATKASENTYVLSHTSTSVNMASLPVSQPTNPQQSVVTQVKAGTGITVTGGDGAGHGSVTVNSTSTGLPVLDTAHGFQPGFGVSSGQNFVMPAGTTSYKVKWDTAYTLETTGGLATLTDDSYFHWDPATPTDFTVKKTGWYWCNWSITVNLSNSPSMLEWGLQPVFGLVNGQESWQVPTKIMLFETHSFLGYIVGPQTCNFTAALLSGQSNTVGYNVALTNPSIWMILSPLF